LAAQRSMPCLLAAGSLAILLALTAITLASSGKTSLQEVSEGLTCQCGCGLTVANCNHPQCEFVGANQADLGQADLGGAWGPGTRA